MWKIHPFYIWKIPRAKQKLPKYVYYCKNCEGDFEIKHTLQETCTICQICKNEGHLERRPSSVFLTQKVSKFPTDLEPGEIMKGAIEEAKDGIALEKLKLKNRKYEK